MGDTLAMPIWLKVIVTLSFVCSLTPSVATFIGSGHYGLVLSSLSAHGIATWAVWGGWPK